MGDPVGNTALEHRVQALEHWLDQVAGPNGTISRVETIVTDIRVILGQLGEQLKNAHTPETCRLGDSLTHLDREQGQLRERVGKLEENLAKVKEQMAWWAGAAAFASFAISLLVKFWPTN